MTNARQIVYLSNVFDGTTYYAGGIANNSMLKTALLNPSTKMMSDVTLDIRDVIITPTVEEMLYKWMEIFDLDVIDTTIEGVRQRFNPDLEVVNPDGTITKGGFEEYLDETPIKFRQDALNRKKELLRLSKSAIDICDFLYYNEGKGVNEFTQEYSAKKLAQKINEHMQSGNRKHRFLLSFGELNHIGEHAESIRQLAAFLIIANAHIAVPKTELDKTVSQYGILPMISQLCFNFETKATAWEDIKKKFVEGSELYFSTNSSSYIKGKVIKNKAYREDGTFFTDVSDYTREEVRDFFSLTVEYTNRDKEVKTIDIQSMFVGNRQVLIFPTSIFEGTVTAVGHPTPEELRANINRSVFLPRSEIVLTDGDLMYLNTGTELTKETDWISLCRAQEEKEYKKHGLEVPKVDLLKIIRGGKSPLVGSFRHKHINK